MLIKSGKYFIVILVSVLIISVLIVIVIVVMNVVITPCALYFELKLIENFLVLFQVSFEIRVRFMIAISNTNSSLVRKNRKIYVFLYMTSQVVIFSKT